MADTVIFLIFSFINVPLQVQGLYLSIVPQFCNMQNGASESRMRRLSVFSILQTTALYNPLSLETFRDHSLMPASASFAGSSAGALELAAVPPPHPTRDPATIAVARIRLSVLFFIR
jgi:hypothetical protein